MLESFKDKLLIADIDLLFKIIKITKWSKDGLAIAAIASLTLPLGFFDVFIQKYVEYHNQKLEDLILLNAKEANDAFFKLSSKKIDCVEVVNIDRT